MRTLVLGGAAALLVLTSGPASAATEPSRPSGQDTVAITALVNGPDTAKRLAATRFPGAAAAGQAAPVAAQVPVFQPTADFVAGRSDVPGQLAYVAVPARTGDGRAATVWAERHGAGWEVVNVASGVDEQRFAAAAGGGYLLHEPQVNAWYAVNGDALTVLDGSVLGLAPGTKLSLRSYRDALNTRYGTRLPGSAYDRSGAAGGYGTPETQVSQAVVSGPATSGPVVLLLVFGGLAVILLAGCAALLVGRGHDH
ncbi:hypothetical protein [Amycolatopsis japonica]|uniref:hypothetical protein n=1 Tax=Amycolatopsis japonica TaxID=208439 RepID=UPI00382CB036